MITPSARDELLDSLERRRHVLARLSGATPDDRPGEGGLLADVPALAHEGPAVDRLELVAPDAAADVGAERSGAGGLPTIRRFSSYSITVLTIEYGNPICIDMPNLLPIPIRGASPFGSRTVPDPSMSR